MEQRYQAVLEVQAGVPVVDVAKRFGVSRQAVHWWQNRYRSGGLQGFLTGNEHWLGGQATELERVASPSGNVKVGPQQFWI